MDQVLQIGNRRILALVPLLISSVIEQAESDTFASSREYVVACRGHTVKQTVESVCFACLSVASSTVDGVSLSVPASCA